MTSSYNRGRFHLVFLYPTKSTRMSLILPRLLQRTRKCRGHLLRQITQRLTGLWEMMHTPPLFAQYENIWIWNSKSCQYQHVYFTSLRLTLYLHVLNIKHVRNRLQLTWADRFSDHPSSVIFLHFRFILQNNYVKI